MHGHMLLVEPAIRQRHHAGVHRQSRDPSTPRRNIANLVTYVGNVRRAQAATAVDNAHKSPFDGTSSITATCEPASRTEG
ncbi:MAG: hypothetical protein QOD58_1030 [Mycobacterium sp.]|nr:hypothetical protein [Mycobacterium sp.]